MKEDPSLKWEEEKELAKESENDQIGEKRTQKEAMLESKGYIISSCKNGSDQRYWMLQRAQDEKLKIIQ